MRPTGHDLSLETVAFGLLLFRSCADELRLARGMARTLSEFGSELD